MKNLLTALSFLCFLSTAVFGQSEYSKTTRDTILPSLSELKEPRFLLNIHTGYAIGLGSTFKFYPDDVRAITVMRTDNGTPQQTTSYSNPSKGLGDGVRFGGGLSYILNDFLNVGLDVDYFSSTIHKLRDSTFRYTKTAPAPGEPNEYVYNERSNISYQATLITFTPNITFKAISRPKWFLYNKLGAVITIRPNSLQTDVTDISIRKGWQGFTMDSSSRIVKKYDWGIKNPAIGFMGAFGMQFKLSQRVRAYAEAQFSHIVFVIRKRTLSEFTVNNKDMKNSLPISMRELVFVKSFTDNSNSNSNPNMPTQTLIQRIPITYIGAQAGITIQLR
ncbi:hypothetical protein BH11BAC3_BH11BAC3_40190 [soil metagenome]